MATNVTQSLFGMTPQAIQSQRAADLQAQALRFAQLTPMQQAQMGLFQAGSQLGTGLAGLMGYEDEEVKQAKARQGLLGGVDMNNPEALLQVANRIQASDPQAAMMLRDQANDLALKQAKTKKETLTLQQEEKLRQELAGLGPEATPEQVEAVVLKYGDPDKILATLERRSTREADRAARIEAAKERHQERLEIARENNASRAQIAQMNREFQREIAQMRLDARTEADRAKQAGKTLPASLQKAEDNDFELIDSAQGVVEDMTPIIQSLTPDPVTKRPSLDLSRFNNMQLQTKAFFGSSDPQVQQFQELERAKTRFVNESLRLNKGVQTEGDAQRAANEVNAAFSSYNTDSMRKALEQLRQINERAVKNKQAQIDRRRTSQGIDPFFSKGTKAPATSGEWSIRPAN
jgi:hypothetical protein